MREIIVYCQNCSRHERNTYPKTKNRKPITFSKEVFERLLKSEVLVFFPTRVWEGNQNLKNEKPMENRCFGNFGGLLFAFLVAFGRRHFSYMCAVRSVSVPSEYKLQIKKQELFDFRFCRVQNREKKTKFGVNFVFFFLFCT